MDGDPRRAGAQPKSSSTRQGLSQEELAHRADIDRTYISALERSVYAASIDVLDRIAKVLEIETADLLKLPPSAEEPGDGSEAPTS